jgi:hypothetical protein
MAKLIPNKMKARSRLINDCKQTLVAKGKVGFNTPRMWESSIQSHAYKNVNPPYFKVVVQFGNVARYLPAPKI